MKEEYTEGIAGDGAAILKSGVQITITEILESLNELQNIKELLSSDSCYNLLRHGVKSPSSSGMDNFEDIDYYDLYTISQLLRSNKDKTH